MDLSTGMITSKNLSGFPFKVPSPKNEDFKEFMNPQHEKESSSKASWLSGTILSDN